MRSLHGLLMKPGLVGFNSGSCPGGVHAALDTFWRRWSVGRPEIFGVVVNCLLWAPRKFVHFLNMVVQIFTVNED